jgi:hypothetical protein
MLAAEPTERIVMSTNSPTYVSVTDTAKEIRKALKHNFAGVKFSVRSKSYSGGASVNVSWTDGPREDAVNAVVKRYEGSTFDGMIDLKSYHTDIVSKEDGSTEVVHWGADFVFTSRNMSTEVEAEIAEKLAKMGTEALYLINKEDRELTAEDCRAGHDLLLPVFVSSPERTGSSELYFSPVSGETNYASSLIRQYFSLLDLYGRKGDK